MFRGPGGIKAQLTLTASSQSGKITYSGGPVTCSGVLALTAAHGQVLVLHQEIDAGKCNSGVITLSRRAAP